MILGARELMPRLMKAIFEWKPNAVLNSAEQTRILKELRARRTGLLSGQTLKTISGLLECMVSSKQIDWALENAFAYYGTRCLEPEIAREILAHQHLLTDTPNVGTLKILVGVQVLAIEIPDPGKDEMTLRLWLNYGAPIDELLCFMVDQGIMQRTEIESTKQRWLQADVLIGNTPEERDRLNSCLRVKIVGEIDQKTKYSSFFIGMRDTLFWKESLEIVTIACPLNLSRYPFDSHLIHLDVENDTNFDISQVMLLPDHTGVTPAIDFSELTIPRGFRLVRHDEDAQPYGRALTPDSLCYSLLRFNFVLQRQADTFVWRTLIPSILMVTLTLLGTYYAIFWDLVNTVMTLIPGVLIALVGMQYSAAQSMPPNSGRTLQDIFFITLYIALFLMFVSLQIESSIYAAQSILLLVDLMLVGTISVMSWLIARSSISS